MTRTAPVSPTNRRKLPRRRRPLRQRAIDTAGAFTIAALLYPAVAWVYRDERRQAGAR